MKTYPGKKYKFDPKFPPKRIRSKLAQLNALIMSLQSDGVYFMADGNLHAFVAYKDGSKDEQYSDVGQTYRPFDDCHIEKVADGIDGGDFW